jgi:hypothetical protein
MELTHWQVRKAWEAVKNDGELYAWYIDLRGGRDGHDDIGYLDALAEIVQHARVFRAPVSTTFADLTR